MIRFFAPGGAEPVAELLTALPPVSVQTAGSLCHRHRGEPARARRGSWIALDGDELVGFGTAWFDWFGGEAGKGRLWVGVRAGGRRRGTGTQLWETAGAHLTGAKKLTVEGDHDPPRLRFVEKRGFTQYDSEGISAL